MNAKNLVVTLMIVSLASLGVGVIGQPSRDTQLLTNEAVSPLSTVTSPPSGSNKDGSILPLIPTKPEIYMYPYYYGGFLEHFVQIIVNADDAQYKDLAMKTVDGVTTITAQQIDITSSYAEVHATDFKLVIDKNKGTATVTAAHIEYDESGTTFTGDNVSFKVTYQPQIIPMAEDTETISSPRSP